MGEISRSILHSVVMLLSFAAASAFSSASFCFFWCWRPAIIAFCFLSSLACCFSTDCFSFFSCWAFCYAAMSDTCHHLSGVYFSNVHARSSNHIKNSSLCHNCLPPYSQQEVLDKKQCRQTEPMQFWQVSAMVPASHHQTKSWKKGYHSSEACYKPPAVVCAVTANWFMLLLVWLQFPLTQSSPTAWNSVTFSVFPDKWLPCITLE